MAKGFWGTIERFRMEHGLPVGVPDPDLALIADLDPDFFFRNKYQDRYAAEPDFELAFGNYLREASACVANPDPPWNPPADFQPDLDPSSRFKAWRCPERFLKLATARMWVMSIHLRVLDGQPGVSLAEFDALHAWFNSNKARVRRLVKNGNGNTPPRPEGWEHLKKGIAQGAKSFFAGSTAACIRLARAELEKSR